MPNQGKLTRTGKAAPLGLAPFANRLFAKLCEEEIWKYLSYADNLEKSFKNKASAIETVTPMLNDDGVWRVSGYYIK